MTPATLNVIRLAILSSILIFGVVAWFLTRAEDGAPTADEGTAVALRYAFYALLVGAAAVLALLRQRAAVAEPFQKRAQLHIVAYAVAEGIAFYGGVYFLLTGSAVLFLVGLLVFLVAFLWFPAA